jgi:GNAT superfamily N-acetyltransferase
MMSNQAAVFQRELGRVTVGDFNASFRGEIYGESGVDADWFADHVGRNGIDLARSPRWSVDGALGGMALLAFRGERAWVGAFGVVPALRGRGYARRFVADTLALAAEGSAASLELEVLGRNAAAIALYERGGFATVGELIVWKRAPLSVDTAAADDRARWYDVTEIARIARCPPTCWQREPPGVAAASPIEAIVAGRAYAFFRRSTGRTSILDAGARDAAAATALLAALDARLPEAEPVLLNEPPHGPLHDALSAHRAWSEFARQRRMLARL